MTQSALALGLEGFGNEPLHTIRDGVGVLVGVCTFKKMSVTKELPTLIGKSFSVLFLTAMRSGPYQPGSKVVEI